MIDPAGAALHAVASGAPQAYPWLLAAGAVSSIGPCVAPRYLAAVALAQRARRPALALSLFVAGICGAYALVAVAVSVAVLASSPMVYAVLGLGLIAAGLAMLVRGHAACGVNQWRGGGAPFLLGAATAATASSCCVPLLAAIAAVSAQMGRELDTAAFGATFALGHSLPLVAGGLAGRRFTRLLDGAGAAQASAIVSGALVLALGLFYAVLA